MAALFQGKHMTHTVKQPAEIFNRQEWGFSANTTDPQLVTPWSARPGIFRCRMRRNARRDMAAFEVRLQEGKLSKCPEEVNVIVYPVHMDAKGNRITDIAGVKGHFTYESSKLEDPVLLPMVVELRNPECTSVLISVTRVREDGAYEKDLARFSWLFGEQANSSQLVWQPRDVRKTFDGNPRASYAGSVYSMDDQRDSASSFDIPIADVGGSRTPRGPKGKIASKAWRITRDILGAPPGAGLGPAFYPQRFDANRGAGYGPTGLLTSPTQDSLLIRTGGVQGAPPAYSVPANGNGSQLSGLDGIVSQAAANASNTTLSAGRTSNAGSEPSSLQSHITEGQDEHRRLISAN